MHFNWYGYVKKYLFIYLFILNIKVNLKGCCKKLQEVKR